jgi:hypothetical protein
MSPENLFPAANTNRSPTASRRWTSSRSFGAWKRSSLVQAGIQGAFSGSIPAISTGTVAQIARDVTSWDVPKGTVVLSVPVNAPRSIFYRGRLLADCSVNALHHGEEVDFRYAGSLDMLTIAVAEGCLQQHAMDLLGSL